ncbi:MAG: DEAD/DEAH box helicase [Trueperaceae bacterium]|nr:DEAD/DEAH box helicase [Trueperaceae bacterium]
MLLWAEREDRSRDGAKEQHPGLAETDAVRRLLEAAAGEAGVQGEASLWLPSTRRGPLPSPPLARPRRGRPPKVTLRRWTVRGQALAPDAAVLALAGWGDSPGMGRAGQTVVLGDDARSWQAAARLALAALARQRMVPGLVHDPAGDADAARWRLLAADDEVAPRLAALRASMPDSCRAASDDPERAPSAGVLLEGFLHAAVDGLTRRWAEGQAPGPGDGPARRWLAALFGPDAEVRASPAQRQRLRDAHRRWLRGLSVAGDDRARVTFRLEEPSGEEDAWVLRPLLQARDDPSLLVDAAEVWRGELGALAQRFAGAPELLLAGIGHAARMFEPLREALRDAAPSEVALSAEQAFTFLRSAAPLLEESGFGVLVPRWWSRQDARLGARLRVAPAPAGGPGSGQVGMQQLMRYRWDVAIGEASLTREEFEALVAHKVPLLRWRGAWVRLDPEQVEAAARFFERREGERDVPLLEAMRTGLGERSEIDDLPVREVDFEGDAGRWLASLAEGEAPQELPEPPGFEGRLRPYQLQGASWLTFATRLGLGVCLADDMGLGKTVQTLAYLLHEREAGHLDLPVLLVCPTSVVRNWLEEAARFAPSLRTLEHQGATRLQGEALGERLAETELVLTSYAVVRRDAESLQAFDWHAVILDEAQNVKNPGTAQSRVVRRLSTRARVALTGTPIENRLDELWSIVDFLDPGYLGARRDFQKRLALPIEREADEGALSTLRRLVAPLVLRRLKTDRSVIRDLPDKIEQRSHLRLSEEQASLYESVMRDAMRAVEESEGIERKGLVLSMLTSLKQICNHPGQFLGETGRDAALGREGERRSPKLSRLTELLDEMLGAGDAALVFTQYRRMGELLVRHLSHRLGIEAPFLHGGVVASKRAEMVRRFQSEDGPSVLVLSLKAGGTGLNLTRASHVFHLDRWWNPAVEDQATDRAFRIGQRRNVQVHTFVTLGTLEERIDEMIDAKRSLAGDVIASGEQALAELDTATLREIVALRREALP